ncbi:universal stress protein [Flavobacterium sp.]|uniref:universal stress protein n=1 Tax=Flavobacterium sp. TaxID=239 RepID=UPI0038FC2EA3
MKRILFPTDFSDTANNAFVYALEMAKHLDAEFIVLHVYDSPNLTYEGCPSSIAAIYETIELKNLENFNDQIPYLRKIAEEHQFESVKMSYILRHGNLIKIIKEISEKENIDLIVMGTHGASGLKEVFLGSNTGFVITQVPTMLLCLPNEAKFEKIKHICFTTLLKDEDKTALSDVLNIAKKFHAKVKCLTIKTSDSKLAHEDIEKWQSNFKREPIEFFVVSNDNIKKTIYDFLERQEIDVLAMLTHRRSFVEQLFTQSLAQKLSFHSKTPILVMHEK